MFLNLTSAIHNHNHYKEIKVSQKCSLKSRDVTFDIFFEHFSKTLFSYLMPLQFTVVKILSNVGITLRNVFQNIFSY